MEFRQLLPEPGVFRLEDDGPAELGPGADGDGLRPHTIANFISSVDGRATFHGRSGPLGDDGDHALFHGLREWSDAVLAGTRTLAAERYGRILGKAERRERRLAAGRPAEPLACIVTRSGMLPADIPLFAEQEARIVVFTGTDPDVGSPGAQIDIIHLDPGMLTLTTVLRRLRSDYQVQRLLCEGGPTLFGSLLDESLVDELFLTVAPKLTGGGSGPTITSGAELPMLCDLELRMALEREGALYLRYALSH
jgi:5-amino-6-(5-phosphoribosylamino)uracil reductase